MAKQPFVPVDGVCRVRLAGLNQSHPWVNGFAVQFDGPNPTQLQLTNFAQTIGALWMSHIAGTMQSGTSLRLVQVWDISSDTGASGQDNAQHNGQLPVSSPLSVQSAVVVSWPVNMRWRGGHFRIYLPAGGTADITNGSTLITNVQSAYSESWRLFKNDLNGSTAPFGPVRMGGVRYFPTGFDTAGNPVPKTEGRFLFFGDPVVHTRLDSQRRRLGKELV